MYCPSEGIFRLIGDIGIIKRSAIDNASMTIGALKNNGVICGDRI